VVAGIWGEIGLWDWNGAITGLWVVDLNLIWG